MNSYKAISTTHERTGVGNSMIHCTRIRNVEATGQPCTGSQENYKLHYTNCDMTPLELYPNGKEEKLLLDLSDDFWEVIRDWEFLNKATQRSAMFGSLEQQKSTEITSLPRYLETF